MDWALLSIIVLYMAKAGLTFFLFYNTSFNKMFEVLAIEIIAAIAVTIIAAIMSLNDIRKCLIGVFVWAASIFTILFWILMDGHPSQDSLGKNFMFSLLAGLILLVLQLINYYIVYAVNKAIKKKKH